MTRQMERDMLILVTINLQQLKLHIILTLILLTFQVLKSNPRTSQIQITSFLKKKYGHTQQTAKPIISLTCILL